MRALGWRGVCATGVLGLLAWSALAQETPASPFSSVQFPLRDLEGREWNRDELQGKVVLVDFWATWCTPCVGELPYLQRTYERHHEAGFVILAVSVDQTESATLRRWLRTHSVSWPQLHDNRGFGGALPLAFGVELVPMSGPADPRLGTLRKGREEEVALALAGRVVHPSGRARAPKTSRAHWGRSGRGRVRQ